MSPLPPLKLGRTHLKYDANFTVDDQPALINLIDRYRLEGAAVVELDYIGTTVRVKYLSAQGRKIGFWEFRVATRTPQGKARWLMYAQEKWTPA